MTMVPELTGSRSPPVRAWWCTRSSAGTSDSIGEVSGIELVIERHCTPGQLGVERRRMTGNTRHVADDEVICTAIDNDWGDDRPNLLMHPPCECPRCAPGAPDEKDDHSWLQLPGVKQRLRVEPAELGETGRSKLG